MNGRSDSYTTIYFIDIGVSRDNLASGQITPTIASTQRAPVTRFAVIFYYFEKANRLAKLRRTEIPSDRRIERESHGRKGLEMISKMARRVKQKPFV